MFKKIVRRLSLSLILLSAGLTACRTAPLPPVDLAEPGWNVRQGQGVWRARHAAPEIAGEILVATAPENRAFVQFSKTPFPVVVAQTTTNAWQFELPTRNKRYSGRGAPPAGLIWFQLPRALSATPLPADWSWRGSATNWRLENRSTGESLEGYFTP